MRLAPTGVVPRMLVPVTTTSSSLLSATSSPGFAVAASGAGTVVWGDGVSGCCPWAQTGATAPTIVTTPAITRSRSQTPALTDRISMRPPQSVYIAFGQQVLGTCPALLRDTLHHRINHLDSSVNELPMEPARKPAKHNMTPSQPVSGPVCRVGLIG